MSIASRIREHGVDRPRPTLPKKSPAPFKPAPFSVTDFQKGAHELNTPTIKQRSHAAGCRSTIPGKPYHLRKYPDGKEAAMAAALAS